MLRNHMILKEHMTTFIVMIDFFVQNMCRV